MVYFEDVKETQTDLKYIKRIYFNIKRWRSVNIRNYIIKSNNEKFIQFAQINNSKFYFKFKDEQFHIIKKLRKYINKQLKLLKFLKMVI